MKYFLRIITGLILLVASVLPGSAQQYRFRHYGAAQGFISRGAETIAQDSAGFLWIGTAIGLFRFDGVHTLPWSFSNFSKEEKQLTKVVDIVIDKKDNIWLATTNALLRMDPVTRKLRVFRHFTTLNGEVVDAKFYSLAPDHQGGIYGISADYLFYIPAGDTTGKQIKVGDPDEENGFYRNTIDADTDGTIYLSIGKRIYRKSPAAAAFTLFREITETPLKDVSRLTVGKHTIWCGNYDHSILMGIDKVSGAYSEYIIQKDESEEEPNSIVMSICEVNDSIVWTGSYVGYGNTSGSGGLSVVNVRSHQVHRIFADASMGEDGSRNAYVEFVFKDRQGSIWAGGMDGIDQYHPTFSEVVVYRPSKVPEDFGIPPSGISDVEADPEGNIWIASKSDGLARINRDGKVAERIPVEKTHLDQSGFIFGVLACGYDGKLYISSTHHVYEVDTRLPDAFDRKHRIVKSELAGGVTHMMVDTKKNLWISTHMDGIYKIAPDGKEEHYYDEGDELHQIPSGGVIGLDLSGDSVLASISNNGVYILREGMKPDVTLSAKALESRGWQKSKVRELKISEHWIVFGTKENGVQYLEKKTGKLFQLTEEEGLLSNIITGIEIDKYEKIWIANAVGLQRYDPVARQLNSYTAMRTLPETGFFNGAHATNKDGLLFFANFGHLISISPDLKNEVIPLHLRILSVKANGKEVFTGNSIPLLSYKENNLQITFSSQNFVNPGDDHYEYFLEGFSREWLPVEGGRMLIFTNLPGGDYLLKLRVKNVSSSHAELAISFFIKTAFYNTWWFRLLVVVFTGALLYMAYRFRIRQLTKVHQLRNDISRDLHDDIGSTLSSVYYSAELLRQQGQQHPELQGKIVDNISNNTRDLVERMRDIVWSIHPDQDDMPEMASRMREYVNRLDLPEGLHISFESDLKQSGELDMRSRRNLYLVFKEAVNNAIKYSKAAQIQIFLTQKDNFIVLTVSDNGTGFDPANTITGNGLRTMKERIEETGGRYQILKGNPGTIIKAEIPFR